MERKPVKTITINGYKWWVKFVDKDDEQIRGCDGRAFYNDFLILVRNDLDEVMTACVLRHELTHAILGIQGRYSQKKFDREEVCEFIGFQLPIIDKLTKQVLGE